MTRACALAVVVAVLATMPARAVTIHVPADQPTIQAGIDAASSGDTVLVACGTYYEHDIVMKSGVCLRSEDGTPECVSIDGAYSGRRFICIDLDRSTRIEGFTVLRGIAGGVHKGGGMYCERASPVLANVVFQGNESRNDGGAIYCEDGSDLLLEDVVFQENRTLGDVGLSGGGMYIKDSSPELRRVSFITNYARYDGGGLACENSSPLLESVLFHDNTSSRYGGGMYCWSWSSPTLTDVDFTFNSAWSRGGGLCSSVSSPDLTRVLFFENDSGSTGGGMFSLHNGGPHPHPSLERVLFWRNRATHTGGGLQCDSYSCPLLTNVTFHENEAGGEGGGVYCLGAAVPSLDRVVIAFSRGGGGIWGAPGSAPVLTCSDVFGNSGGDYGGAISDQTGLAGNISQDPVFCDPENGNFMIDEMSPCAPENNSCGVLMGAYGIGCGASAVQSTSWGGIKAMWR